jgi:Tfp pilus assembly protein PilN
MATTMIPPTAAPKPPPSTARYVVVRANLLPDEIVSGRQVEVVRKQMLIGLVVVAILLIGWFGLSWWQTSSANGDLNNAQRQGTALQNQQNEFGSLVQAQGQTTTIQAQLQRLMVGDLSWKAMLTTLRAKAPNGLLLTVVDGSVTAGAAAAGAAVPDSAILNSSGKETVGELRISGTAPDKRTVAAYADQLASVPGLAAPLILSVDVVQGSVTFSVSVLITSDALGGRYAVPATSLPTTTGGN